MGIFDKVFVCGMSGMPGFAPVKKAEDKKEDDIKAEDKDASEDENDKTE